ncbi:MAG: helix-turn-helix domain-containing protein [Holosporales bacterium]|jgi:transcriptional regulator with XRE-family HTH domain
MSKSSRAQQALPSTLPTLLTELGAGIAIARKRRRITLKQMAERMMVSLDTVQRLEKGDSGVGIGIVATALWVLGLQDRLQGLTDPARDHVALAQDLQRLPKAVHAPKRSAEEFDF